MPGRFYGRRRMNPGLGRIVDSNKNMPNAVLGIAAATTVTHVIAVAVDAAANTTANEVTRGCKIFKIYLEFWYYGQAVGPVNDIIDAYIIKNPGNNLTVPTPSTVGTSNEKKFVFREWKGLVGRKADGGVPYQFKGWLKIPKVYQRMGADDQLQFVIRSPTVGDLCIHTIYKWYK